MLGGANAQHVRNNSDFGDLIKEYEQNPSSLKRSATMPPQRLAGSENSTPTKLSVQSSNNATSSPSKLDIQSSKETKEEPKKGIVAKQKEAYLQETRSSPLQISSSSTGMEVNSIEEAKKKIKELEEQVSNLRFETEQKSGEAKKLDLLFKDSELQREQMETAFKQQNETLKQRVSKQRQEIEEEKSTKSTLELSVKQLKEEIEKYKKDINENKKKIESLEKEKNKQTENYEKTISSLKENKSSASDLQKQITDLMNQLTQKDKTVSSLENELKTSKDLQNKLSEREKEIQNIKNSLEKQLKEQKELYNSEKERWESENKQKGNTQTEIKKLEETIQKLKKENQSSQETIEELRSKTDQAYHDLTLTQNELTVIKSKLETKVTESAKLSLETKGLKEENSKLLEQLEEKQLLEKSNSSIKEGAEQLKSEKQRLEKEIATLKTQIKGFEEKIKELEQANSEIKQKSDTINKLTTECSTLKGEKEKLSSLNRELETNLVNQKKELESQFKEQLTQALETQSKSSNQQSSILDLQLEDLRDQVDDLKKANTNLENELKNSESKKNQEIETYKSKIQQLESSPKPQESKPSSSSFLENVAKLMEQERRERFILDQSILCFDNCTFSNQIPTPVKSIYHSLNYWLESSETFGPNLVASLSYKFKSLITHDLQKACYWLNVMLRVLHLLKSGEAYEKKIKNIMKNNIIEKQFTSLTNNEEEKQAFLNLVYATISESGSTSPSVDKFLIGMSQLIYDSYFECIKTMLVKSKTIILEKLFGVTQNNPNPQLGKMSSDVKIDAIVKLMKSWMDQIKLSQLDSRLIIHMFETLGHLMDSFIFNQFITFISNERKKAANMNQLKDVSMNHAIHLKMSVSFLESFFFEEHLTEGLNIQDLFHQTRVSFTTFHINSFATIGSC